MKRIEIVDSKPLGGKNPLFEHTVQTDLTEKEFESWLEEGKSREAEKIHDKVTACFMREGYLFGKAIVQGGMMVYAGNTIKGVKPSTFIASVHIVSPAKATIDSKGSELPAAIEALENLLASCGFSDVGTHSGLPER